ncbi:MAG: hypothetical protein IT373_13830 [Polyangiaceae bacterium]|nr:hypothetical protein [Polyangiaceae bacterium]
MSAPHDPARVTAASARRRAAHGTKLLDGWQAAAIVVVLAASAVLLGVPRAVEPDEPPTPVVDEAALGATIADDDALATRAEATELDADVRAVGRELRAFNQATRRQSALRHDDPGDDGKVRPSEAEIAQARGRLVRATAQALLLGDADLLALRAYQTRAFVRELESWRATGVESEELVALGGDILQKLVESGWCVEQGGERRLAPDARVLRAMYKKRWNDLVGVAGGRFAPTRDEERLRYGFLMRHPPLPADPPRPELAASGAEAHARRLAERDAARDRMILGLVGKLEGVDPSYPADLARGVLLFRLQEFGAATDALRRHLDGAPDGPYALRAQNYLKACLDRTTQGLY